MLGSADAFRALLAPEERARAERFHQPIDASRFAVCRGILRRALGSYSNAEPSAIVLAYGAHGKPALSPTTTGDAVHFNVAHDGGIALMAFTRAAEIGIDIERVQTFPDLDSLMRASFSKPEREHVGAIANAEARTRAFFRCWTRKEAILKALGWGLARELDSFDVTIGEDDTRLVRMEGDQDIDAWRLVHLEPRHGFVGAAAWKGSSLDSECFTYEA
ncbi:MAG: 4'-phosphopantetheinyl transferase family protein [Gemmatimonadaceae bacterium]